MVVLLPATTICELSFFSRAFAYLVEWTEFVRILVIGIFETFTVERHKFILQTKVLLERFLDLR